MDFPSQLSSRLVSHLWTGVSTKLVLQLDRRLEFKFDDQLKKYFYHLPHQLKNESKSLSDLNSVLCSSSSFPCTNFRFIGGNLATEDITKFFSLWGSQLKSLSLEPTKSPQPTQATLRRILEHLAPSIQNLELGQFWDNPWTNENRLSLPSLKTLKCLMDDEIRQRSYLNNSTAMEMLDYAPNLTCILKFNLANIDRLFSLNKIGSIRELSLSSPHADFPQQLERVSLFVTNMVSSQLSRLTIQGIKVEQSSLEFQEPFGLFLTSILEANSDSLERLDMDFMGTISTLKFPHLRNLKKLNVTDTLGYPLQNLIFPAGTELDETFPVLQTLELRLGTNKFIPPFELANHFGPNPSTLLGVHELNIKMTKRVSLHPFFELLFDLMPNVVRLRVVHSRLKCMNLIPIIFEKWPNLNELELLIYVNGSEDHHLDAAFTGMTIETCERLRNEFGTLWKIEDMKRLKVTTGIHDFQSNYLKNN